MTLKKQIEELIVANSISEKVNFITIFGSARMQPSSYWYTMAVKAAKSAAECGFSVMTGGGPGIMEAANKGACQSINKVESIGIGIKLPHEQDFNDYTTWAYECDYFHTRKWAYIKNARAFIVFPGGFGTLDELFEVLTLIQTGKIKQVPVILVDCRFWNGLLAWIIYAMDETEQYISKGDLQKYTTCVDTIEEIETILKGL